MNSDEMKALILEAPNNAAGALLAAQLFLDRIDNITMHDFSLGKDNPEREHLRFALESLGAMPVKFPPKNKREVKNPATRDLLNAVDDLIKQWDNYDNTGPVPADEIMQRLRRIRKGGV